ncbi:MAG: hypothetical protein HKN37_01145 [Rhodothermales bacterium]|nr:hypothetical protein [Rhodothermales bacterium]
MFTHDASGFTAFCPVSLRLITDKIMTRYVVTSSVTWHSSQVNSVEYDVWSTAARPAALLTWDSTSSEANDSSGYAPSATLPGRMSSFVRSSTRVWSRCIHPQACRDMARERAVDGQP